MPTRYAGTTDERAALDAYIKLWRAAHAAEVAAHRHLADHGLTISQFGVLEGLYHLGPLSQRQGRKKSTSLAAHRFSSWSVAAWLRSIAHSYSYSYPVSLVRWS